MSKVGRNDPCTCGSGKKYKQCCALKEHPSVKKKFKATLISGGQKDLIERTFSSALSNPPELPPTPIETPIETPKE